MSAKSPFEGGQGGCNELRSILFYDKHYNFSIQILGTLYFNK
jgi:hypothetical protein